MKETDDPEVKEYLTARCQAKWVVCSIEQRGAPYVLVPSASPGSIQEAFFRRPGHLVPT